MGKLGAWLYRALDALLDERQARHTKVINKGLVIRGEWETGRLFVHGEELEPEDGTDEEKPWGQLRDPTPNFRWGTDTADSRPAARAILGWFLDDRERANYLTPFHQEVVARLPRDDFEVGFNFERWRNRLLSNRSMGQTAQPTGDHLAEMGGQQYVHQADLGDGDGH